jgi:hypothetical protein
LIVLQRQLNQNRGHRPNLRKILYVIWSRGQVETRLANMPACLIGMEACVGAHHLSRRLRLLGHDARLMPAKYVRAYSKGQKNEFRDAEAIAEAVQNILIEQGPDRSFQKPQLRVGQSTVGQEFLLPAFTGALLGTTAIYPGRTNVWGTPIAVALSAVAGAGRDPGVINATAVQDCPCVLSSRQEQPSFSFPGNIKHCVAAEGRCKRPLPAAAHCRAALLTAGFGVEPFHGQVA